MFCSNQQGNLFPICELAVVGSYASGILYLTAQIRRCQHWTRAEYAFLFHEVSLPTHMSGLMLYSLPLRTVLRDMAGQSLTSLGQT